MRDKLLLGGGLVAIACGLRWAGRLLFRKDWGGLDTIVSFSSRMIAGEWRRRLGSRFRRADAIGHCDGFTPSPLSPTHPAATRAIESQEEAPLVKDPLAKVLAGPKAMARAQARGKASKPSLLKQQQHAICSAAVE